MERGSLTWSDLVKTRGSKKQEEIYAKGTITVFLHFRRLQSEPGERNYCSFWHTYGGAQDI